MSVRDKIGRFKRKAHHNSGRRGLLSTAILFIALFLSLVLLENFFWYGSTVRTVMFYGLIVVTLFWFFFYAIGPFLRGTGIWKADSDETAAKNIGSKMPELKDQLINYLQLEKSKSELAKANIERKNKSLGHVNFLNAIDFSINKKYAKILAVLLIAMVSLAFISPPVIKNGTERLIRHHQDFQAPLPFKFVILNDSLTAFRNQPFELQVLLDGKNIPQEVELLTSDSKVKMQPSKNGTFYYSFSKMAEEITFRMEASGYRSQEYEIALLNKPVLDLMALELDYPSYTGKKDEASSNDGNISAPVGTKVKWSLFVGNSDKARFIFPDDTLDAKRLAEDRFTLNKKLENNGAYTIELTNKYARNESLLSYRIDLVPDEFPSIDVTYLPDTTFYKYVVITGDIKDDYGFKQLNLVQEVNGGRKLIPIEISRKNKQQKFYAEWFADSAGIASGEDVTLSLEVQDNDAINGPKTVKSSVFRFNKPDLSEISDLIGEKSESAEKQIDKSLKEVESLREKLKELSDRLKSEKESGWQEEKLIEESLEQREEIEQMLEELQEKHEELIKANQNFEQSKELQEKSEQLDQLIEDLMDPETQQLYDELKKLLEEKANSDELRDKLSEISRQENRMAKDLERTKELFKRMKLEVGLEQLSQRLDSLAQEQMDLSEQGLDSASMANQEQIQKDFEKISEDLEEMEELNQELEKPAPLEDFNSDEQQINKEMDNAMEQMQQGDQQKSKKSQQNAAQQMQKMSKQMQSMQGAMQGEVMQENIEQLRKILDDLVKLSYRQEDVLNEFREVNSSDPRFISLSQDQIKLKEDLVVIEDSLLALASRVVTISSFITKEIEDINMHMDEAVTQIKERQRNQALSHQQFSMTSMNNLALLLNDVLQNMQMTMAESMGKGSDPQPSDMPLPSLGEMQQQLSEQIKDLGENGQSGKQLSEELARLAAEQEMIRQQLKQLQEQMEGQMGNDEISENLGKAMKLMEDNEVDLVNKRISRQLIERQKEITTRMLEAEDALREQEKDPEREGETAQQRNRIFPPDFEEYLRERKKEIELLKSVPIELKPFYKKEVNDYFSRLSETSQ